MACPRCRRGLSWDEASTICDTCSTAYPIVEGIASLLPTPLRDDPYKLSQADSHDIPGSGRFEGTRPRRTPRFYGLLMEEKLSRSVSALRRQLAGSTAVVICAGSGMDAEFLARQGASTLAFDVSIESCKRTNARAQETGLPILAVLGDAEHLPLRDSSVDLAYVHDGLHHLENYFSGLGEMLRVAGQAISISEPTQAVATAVSVRFGLSEEVEESGNTVHRMPIGSVVKFLSEQGFRPVKAQRYAMYYRHEPGPVVRLLSRERLAPASLVAFRIANRIIGPVGNKMSVQAVRDGR